MSTSNNPRQPGDRVQVRRGVGWLRGIVIKTVLARCFIQLDDSARVVVDNYGDIRDEVLG